DPDTMPPIFNGPGGGVRYCGLGYLFKTGLMRQGKGQSVSGKVFYCPANTSKDNDYDQPGNPWPPIAGACRSSYSVRPCIFRNGLSGTAVAPNIGPAITSSSTDQWAKTQN